METIKDNNKILLELSDDEALVLLNWLFRFNASDNDTFFEDQAEQRVLWDMEAVLERAVSATFDNNYQEILSKARQKIRDEE
ncbi:hypothetical protein DSECCO2_526490 [anaerobic digester metagenome]